MRLKKNYSSREVAALTGLTARQLQWWDSHRVVAPAIASRPTEAGGFTERRYSPIDLYELLVLADLRRRGFTVGKIRLLLDTLKARFGVRLYQTISGGSLRLLTDGREIFVRTEAGEFFNVLRAPDQPLLEIGQDADLKQLSTRARARRKAHPSRKSPAPPEAASRQD